jgi:acetyl esterase
MSVSSEFRVLRAVCGLPAGAQRLVFGPPPTLDGQTLASDIHALLRLAAWAGDTSITGREGTSPEQARARNRRGAAATAGPRRAMARVERLEIPGPAGTIPARLYVPLAKDGFNGAVPGDGPDTVSAPDRDGQPLLVYFHGGGWVIGDLDTHDSAVRFLAAEAGVAVLSVEYRLAPEHPFPAAVEDSFAAFRWAVENAADLGANPGRVAVGGDSAGGNLAAAVSLLARDGGGPAPAMQLLIYPVTDAIGGQESRRLFAENFLLTTSDMEWFERHYLPDGAARDPRVSMLHAEDLSGLAPAYVTTAGFDPLRDEGEAYAERMRAAGAPVALRRHPELIHSFANLTAISRSARAAMSEVAGALRMGLS